MLGTWLLSWIVVWVGSWGKVAGRTSVLHHCWLFVLLIDDVDCDRNPAAASLVSQTQQQSNLTDSYQLLVKEESLTLRGADSINNGHIRHGGPVR